jgi:hypothetical protein
MILPNQMIIHLRNDNQQGYSIAACKKAANIKHLQRQRNDGSKLFLFINYPEISNCGKQINNCRIKANNCGYR